MCNGGIHAGSCYLTSCNAGVDDLRNLDALQLMTGVLRVVRGPWVIGGDWNCTPEELKKTGWLQLVEGRVVAPNSPTCGDRVIDFFVIAECLMQFAPQNLHDWR